MKNYGHRESISLVRYRQLLDQPKWKCVD